VPGEDHPHGVPTQLPVVRARPSTPTTVKSLKSVSRERCAGEQPECHLRNSRNARQNAAFDCNDGLERRANMVAAESAWSHRNRTTFRQGDVMNQCTLQ